MDMQVRDTALQAGSADYKPSRDQRQALNRWNKYILGEHYLSEVKKRFPKSKEEKKRDKNGFDLVETVHEAERERLKPVRPAHEFKVTLEPDDFTEEKCELWRLYQMHVHHEKEHELAASSFKRFLCSSPLDRCTRTKDGTSTQQPMGSFHQCYRVDGRLVAFGVLDLLPHAVSGVYFIYHPDFEKWSFGKVSAMREAALALEKGYNFYYMGFYIHVCTKMLYKGDYKPQYVLDPENYHWDPLDGELRTLLDRKKYVSLSRFCWVGRGEDVETNELRVSEDQGFPYPVPAEAADSGLSLLELQMPGVLGLEAVRSEVNLDDMCITFDRRRAHTMKDLVSWDTSSTSLRDPSTLPGAMAEFAACIGPELASEVIVDFGG
ncbi:Arginyl-tRNA--protein transferase 1 [Taxawa tesnikishii (nom. ined.)]|nr:Arginyl-tRNA--protein transferase 1 [Dothideales sp. JES 119]